MKKVLSIVLTAAIVLSLFTGFTLTGKSAKAEETTISVLTSQGNFKQVYNEMTSQLEKDTGYKIDWQVVPDDQYYNLVKAKIATNEVPDIIEYNTPSNNIELNVQKNCIPLNSEPWAKRLVNPTLLKDPTDGKIYAMPRDSGSFFGAAYFNKKTLKSLGVSTAQPKTYREFLDRLQQIKVKSKGKVAPIYVSHKDTWTTQIFMTLGFPVAVYPNDGAIEKDLLANKKKFTDIPEFKKILGDYRDLFKKGLVNKDNLSATYDMSKEALANGKAAMVLQGEWFVSDVKAKWPTTEFGSWIVPFNDKLIMGTGAFVRGFFVMKNGKQADKAKDFLNKWSQKKYQDMLYAKEPGFPAFKDVNGGKVDDSVKSLIDNYIKTKKFTYQINDPMGVVSPIWPDLWKMYVDMVATGKDPAKVLESWQKKYEDYMKQKQQPGF